MLDVKQGKGEKLSAIAVISFVEMEFSVDQWSPACFMGHDSLILFLFHKYVCRCIYMAKEHPSPDS